MHLSFLEWRLSRGNRAFLFYSLISLIERFGIEMSLKFDTKRIYELPVLRHNTAAVKLIYENVFHETLSDSFLHKMTEHNTLLTKLSMSITECIERCSYS